jgi:hypothetical protein
LKFKKGKIVTFFVSKNKYLLMHDQLSGLVDHKRFRFEMLHSEGRYQKQYFRKESLGALCLMLYYYILARQVKRAVPIGRQALQEIHSALSGSSPERQRMGRSG